MVAVILYGLVSLSTSTPIQTCHEAQLQARDELQTDYTGELVCLYMTDGVNWTGEGQNICEVPGQCGEHDPRHQLPDCH